MTRIIGIGTGRCGTKSLAGLLNLQKKACVTHETKVLPWESTEDSKKWAIEFFLSPKNELFGDVGYFWVNYVPLLCEHYPDLKIIVLERPKEEVAQSFMKWIGSKDHWLAKPKYPDKKYDPSFPKMDGSKTKKERILAYCDLYADLVSKLSHPHIFKLKTTELNENSVVFNLFSFLEVSDPVIKVVHRNANKK